MNLKEASDAHVVEFLRFTAEMRGGAFMKGRWYAGVLVNRVGPDRPKRVRARKLN